MFYNTLDSYGTSGTDGFILESETPDTVDSNYSRHISGGSQNVKEATNKQESTSVFSDGKN